jgi:hypothetical protein
LLEQAKPAFWSLFLKQSGEVGSRANAQVKFASRHQIAITPKSAGRLHHQAHKEHEGLHKVFWRLRREGFFV